MIQKLTVLALLMVLTVGTLIAEQTERPLLLFGEPQVEELRLAKLIRSEPSTSDLGLRVELLVERLCVQSLDARDAGAMSVLGQKLWRSATHGLQSDPGEHWDDRDLYWARLAIKARLRSEAPSEAVSKAGKAGLAAFERSSRGFEDVQFADSDTLRVVLTGFDPFHLDRHLDQSNPSGLAAIALDGRKLETAVGQVRVETAVFPVRFADFDQGMVEDFIEPVLRRQRPDLVLTVSMGRDAFDLERFPGRRRSSAVTDNLNILTGANPAEPLIPVLKGAPLDGPEFLEFSLPAAAMSADSGAFPVRDNRRVQTLASGAFEASSLVALRGQIAVAGSGGGYLSNEISYRTLLVNQQQMQTQTPMGHLHTPRVEGFDADLEERIVNQIEQILIAAIEAR